MKEPQLHYATDRRCYNGAFCSDLQKEFDSKDKILKAIRAKYPEYFCTYFPVEGKYMSFLKYKEITSVFHVDRGECLLEAWRLLIRDGGQS